MRIDVVKTKVYPFDELSDEAKQTAVENLCSANVDYEWWEWDYEDAANVLLKLTEFDLGQCGYCRGDFIEYAENTAKAIIEQHGSTCDTYKTAEAYLDEIDQLWVKWPDKVNEGYDENESDREDERCNIDDEFLKSILEDYRTILQKNYEYKTSEKAIIEMIEANGYEFTEDGKQY